MTLRCKAGDLVVCVEADYPELIGRVFKVTKLTERWKDCWRTEPPQFTASDVLEVVFEDSTLRPIRDPGEDAQDETLAWKPLPLPEIVPAMLDREVEHG